MGKRSFRGVQGLYTQLITDSRLQSSSVTKVLLHHLRNGQRFILPDEGVVFFDKDLKGLDTKEKLHLPFDSMVLEFDIPSLAGSLTKVEVNTTGATLAKAVVIVSTDYRVLKDYLPEEVYLGWIKREPLVVFTFMYSPQMHGWMPFSATSLATVDWGGRESGEPPVLVTIPIEWEVLAGGGKAQPAVALGYGMSTVVGLLNVLACSNVQIHRVVSKTLPVGRPVLPFSDHWELRITTSSPKKVTEFEGMKIVDRQEVKEYVRAGHVRHLASGAKVWVNAVVVNAGKGGKPPKSKK